MGTIEIIFLFYLFILIVIGLGAFNHNKTKEDYLLAGRNLGPWVTAFSERASGESAWLLLALPGAVITTGLSISWSVLGIILGIIFSWYLIAERLRSETEKYNALTIPDYLHKRFNDTSNTIRTFSAVIITFFFLFYVSAQFHASGKILHSLFNLDPLTGISLGAFVILTYTLIGGFTAVAWTDFIQGLLMIGTLVILPLAGFIELSEAEITIEKGLELSEKVFQNNNSSFFKGNTGFPALITVLTGLSWGLGYLGQPHLLIRYMAIRSTNDIPKARIIAIAWAIPAVIGAFFVGIISILYFGPTFFETIDPEQAMPILTEHLLPPFLAGLFISGAVAAMMSTADSQLLVTASAITEDFFYNNKVKSRIKLNAVNLNRIVIVIIGLIAYSIAIFSEIKGNNIFSIVSYAWSGLGSAFGPALVLSLWWKKTTRKGIIAGILTGFFSTIIWSNISFLNVIITERLVSFILALLAIVIISIFYHDKT